MKRLRDAPWLASRGTAPLVPGDQWASIIRMHAAGSGRDPDRLRERPPLPPPHWLGGEAVPIEWRTPTVPYLFRDPQYVGAIRAVLARDHGLDVTPDPEDVHRFAVAGLLAGEAARRIAAGLAPRVEPQPDPAMEMAEAIRDSGFVAPEPERTRVLMEPVTFAHSGRAQQASLF